MREQIFWSVIAGSTLGVFARTLIPFGWTTIGFCVLLAAIAPLVLYMARARMHPAIIGAIFLLAFAGGTARMHVGIHASDPVLDAELGEKVVIEGVITDEPDVRENNVRLPVHIISLASTTIASGLSILVVAPLHTEVAYGDVIRAEGKLEAPETFDTGSGRIFDYPGYLAKDGILYQMSFAKATRTGANEGNFLKSWAIWIKQKYLEGLGNAIGEPQAGLAGGITVGDKRGLGTDLAQVFRIVGLTHVVVLSGYNITVVIDALTRMLSFAPRLLRLSGSVFIAVFFAAITGFASASVRAAAMATIAVVGKATGRIYLAARALAVVALGMMLWNPYVLVYDPGFQLSILATAGLIALSPIIAPYVWFVPERFGLREVAISSLSAQLAVLPLLLYENGMLSIFALPVNLLVLASIPSAMLFSAIAACFGLFAGAIAPIIGLPAYILLSYAIYVAKGFAALPFSAVSVPAFSPWLLIPIYALYAWIVFKKRAAGPKVPPHA